MSHPNGSGGTEKQTAGKRRRGSRPRSPSGTASAAQKGATAKTRPLESVRDLLEYAYALDGKQLRISQKVAQEIADANRPERPAGDDLPERLKLLMKSDPLLGVPPRIMIGLEEAQAPTLLKLRVAKMLEFGLRRHPLLVSPTESPTAAEVSAVVGGQTDLDSVFTRIRLRTPEITAVSLGLQRESLTPAERDRMSVNATTSIALLAATIDQWSLDRFVEYLERHLWRGAVTKPRALHPLVAIVESSSSEALGAVATVFLRRSESAERTAQAAVQSAMEAEERARNVLARADAVEEGQVRLRSTIDSQREEIATLQRQIAKMHSQIDEQKRDRVIDQSHHIDDFEDLRTRIIRSLGKQVDLLSDGLHAVRNQSYSVTEEFIERSLESLSKELRQLNDEGDG